MHAKKLMLMLLLCLATPSVAALAPEVAKAGEELVSTLKDEMKALEGDDDEAGRARDVQAIRQYLRQVQNALAQDNIRQFDQLLANFGDYEPTPKVLGCLEALKKSIKDGFNRKTEAVVAELEGLLAAAADKVTRAEEPADLDKVLVSLSSNRLNNGDDGEAYDSNNPAIRKLVSEISSARRFATSWQDYLQASNAGNASQALQALRNLAQNEPSLIPRSQLIARIEFEQADEDEVTAILNEIKKPTDLKEGIRKLSKLVGSSRYSSENPEPREILLALGRMEKTYREFLAGLPVKVDVLQPSDSTGPASNAKLIELRAALLLMVLPRVLDLPDGLLPAEGESVDRFLARAMEDATRRDDLGACLRISDLRQLLVRSANFSDKDLDALRSYAAGRNQSEAGQYLLAVVSLQTALKSGSELVPAAKTGALLETIRKDHPEEYEQGMMEFLTPRTTPESDYSRMPYRNHLPPYQRYPDGDPRQGGPTVVLPVPPREAAKPEGKAPGKE